MMFDKKLNSLNQLKMVKRPLRGDIFYMRLGTKDRGDSLQGGNRPCLIIQNDIGNEYSPTVIVAPLTSNLNKNPLPTHIFISKEEAGLESDSLAVLEQIVTIPTDKLIGTYIGKISDKTMLNLNHAIEISLGLQQEFEMKEVLTQASHEALEAEILYKNCINNSLCPVEMFEWAKNLKKQKVKALSDLCDKYEVNFYHYYVKYEDFIK